MTLKEFKLWLVKNDHTQKSLAKKLGISEQTISNYCKNERFPIVFALALLAISRGLNNGDLNQ